MSGLTRRFGLGASAGKRGLRLLLLLLALGSLFTLDTVTPAAAQSTLNGETFASSTPNPEGSFCSVGPPTSISY